MKSQTPIIADKELFRLWYEFYRLALISSDAEIQKELKKSQRFYLEWHGSENLHFDDWWRSHRSLFHDDKVVRLYLMDDLMTEDNIYVSVPRGKSYGDIM